MAKVRKAVITAAGRGTRQYPASSAVQKEMFPLVDRDGLTKPIVQIIGEEEDAVVQVVDVRAADVQEQVRRPARHDQEDQDPGRDEREHERGQHQPRQGRRVALDDGRRRL